MTDERSLWAIQTNLAGPGGLAPRFKVYESEEAMFDATFGRVKDFPESIKDRARRILKNYKIVMIGSHSSGQILMRGPYASTYGSPRVGIRRAMVKHWGSALYLPHPYEFFPDDCREDMNEVAAALEEIRAKQAEQIEALESAKVAG